MAKKTARLFLLFWEASEPIVRTLAQVLEDDFGSPSLPSAIRDSVYVWAHQAHPGDVFDFDIGQLVYVTGLVTHAAVRSEYQREWPSSPSRSKARAQTKSTDSLLPSATEPVSVVSMPRNGKKLWTICYTGTRTVIDPTDAPYEGESMEAAIKETNWDADEFEKNGFIMLELAPDLEAQIINNGDV